MTLLRFLRFLCVKFSPPHHELRPYHPLFLEI
jgi:hypothetical protein